MPLDIVSDGQETPFPPDLSDLPDDNASPTLALHRESPGWCGAGGLLLNRMHELVGEQPAPGIGARAVLT
jgi:hypothetical protein